MSYAYVTSDGPTRNENRRITKDPLDRLLGQQKSLPNIKQPMNVKSAIVDQYSASYCT